MKAGLALLFGVLAAAIAPLVSAQSVDVGGAEAVQPLPVGTYTQSRRFDLDNYHYTIGSGTSTSHLSGA